MSYQTVADSTKLILGSAKVEIGTSIATLASIGVGWGVKLTEQGSQSELPFDNGAGINLTSKTGMLLEMEGAEFDLEKIKTVFAAPTDAYSTTSGTTSTGHVYVVASGDWGYNKFIELDHQNGSKAKITPTSVTGGTDGLLVLDTDYVIVEQTSGSGVWGIAVIDSTTVTTAAQSLTIVYDYTPLSSKSLIGKASTYVPTSFVVRATHTNDAGKKLQVTLFKASSKEFIQINFVKDGGSEASKMPYKFLGTADATNQIYEILDEISA